MPIETIALRELRNPSRLRDAQTTWEGFVQLMPAEQARPPEVFMVAQSPDVAARYYPDHCRSGTVDPIGCYFISNVTACGHLNLFLNGRLIVDGSHISMVQQDWLASYPYLAVGCDPNRSLIELSQPAIPLGGPGHQVFGHWIIDYLPRLAVARELLGNQFYQFKIVLLHDTPKWAFALLKFCFGLDTDHFLLLDWGKSEILLTNVCLPTFAHSNGLLFHSFLPQFYRRLVPERQASAALPIVTGGRNGFGLSRLLDIPRKLIAPLAARNKERQGTGKTNNANARRVRRICVARRKNILDPRSFTSKSFFERTAQELGYELLIPNEMSIQSQIAAFSAADVIVGEYGSALHNSVFSRAGTVLGVLNIIGIEQTRLCAAFNQKLVMLPADWSILTEDGTVHWNVQEEKITTFFAAVDAVRDADNVRLLKQLTWLGTAC